jgi:hypothetical protein
MKARSFGCFVAIAFAVLVLMLACQSIVLHLGTPHRMTSIDYYLADVVERTTPWDHFRRTILGDVAVFLHSPFLIAYIVFWLATSALSWGIFVTLRQRLAR